MLRGLVALACVAGAAFGGNERREISDYDEFRRVVSSSRRVFLVEFYSGMCGYCQQFEPTWLELASEASRLEPARVNIDADSGLALATRLGILDEGIPCVVVFNRAETTAHETLMAGELFPLSRLLKRVYKTTKGLGLRTDADGFFLRAASSRR